MILNIEAIRGEESELRVKIGDGEHWWSDVKITETLFPYYRKGMFTRGRIFNILESHMEGNTLVIVSLKIDRFEHILIFSSFFRQI